MIIYVEKPRVHQKTISANTQSQQGCRIQDQQLYLKYGEG